VRELVGEHPHGIPVGGPAIRGAAAAGPPDLRFVLGGGRKDKQLERGLGARCGEAPPRYTSRRSGYKACGGGKPTGPNLIVRGRGLMGLVDRLAHVKL
jgi:hypothetical protein